MQGTGLRKLLLSPLGFDHPALAIAASRAGGTGVLDLELSRAPALAQLQLLARQAGKQGFGVRLGGFDGELAEQLIQLLDAGLNLLILGREHWAEWQGWLAGAALTETTLLLELSDNDQLDSAIAHRVDGLLLKGHEAAGFVGESSAFILIQHWRATCDLPLYLRGGITPHTAAAAALAGCAGVALDSQVLLLQESPLATELQTHLRSLSGSETVAAGNGEFGRYCRILSRPGFAKAKAFIAAAESLTPEQMRERLLAEVEWRNPPAGLLPLGQDVAFAAAWQKQYGSVAQLFQAIDAAVQHNPQLALNARALRAEHAPLADALGLTLPLASFRWTQGSAAAYASSTSCLRYFCAHCGCHLALFTALSPDSLDITVASLDHPEQAPADRHIWVGSRLPWLQLDPGLPEEHEEQL